YLRSATGRIRSIFQRGGLQPAAAPGPIILGERAERALVLRLLGFGAAVAETAETAEPHKLAGFVFDLASDFTTFYEECPVLQADSQEVRNSRLALAALTLKVLLSGLDLLGIPVPGRMETAALHRRRVAGGAFSAKSQHLPAQIPDLSGRFGAMTDMNVPQTDPAPGNGHPRLPAGRSVGRRRFGAGARWLAGLGGAVVLAGGSALGVSLSGTASPQAARAVLTGNASGHTGGGTAGGGSGHSTSVSARSARHGTRAL